MIWKRLFALQAALAVALLLVVAVYAARVLDRHLGVQASLGGRNLGALKPETTRFLAGVKGRIDLTYFVSSRKVMPSAMQEVEKSVRALLAALKAAAPQHLDYRVLDPGSFPQASDPRDAPTPPPLAYASGRSASPFKVKKVLRDESAEEIVWSSLVVAFDKNPDSLLQGITAFDLPYLEDLILESLRKAEVHAQPVVAISAPSRGFTALPGLVTSLAGARVIAWDPRRDAQIPRDADLLFWIDPPEASAEQAEDLKRFLDSGRAAILAGSTYSIEHSAATAGWSYRARRSTCDWPALLRPFGLAMVDELVTDKRHEPITWKTGDAAAKPLDASFQLRILPSQTDMRGFLGPSAGALVVTGVSPLALDPRTLAARSLEADVVSTTSEFTQVRELPEGEFGDDLLNKESEAVPKQPWLVSVKSRDPWKGPLLVAGSASLFHDDIYAQGGNANQVFLRTLLRTFTDGGRLARIRVPRVVPEPIPQISLAARLAWRAIVVFLLPALLLILAFRAQGGVRLRSLPVRGSLRTAAGALAFVGVVVLAGRLAGGRGPALDLTEDKTNTPSPFARGLFERYRDGLAAEVILSEGFRMPVSLKSIEPRVLGVLRGLGMRPRILRPEDLSPADRAALKSSGIEPFEEERVEDDASLPVKVWSSVRLTHGGKAEVIPRIDSRTIGHFDFLLAAAVRRFESPAPLVGVLSDLPRLSPAEAHEDYQQKGYTAPIGSDVYSFAKSLLVRHGYRVTYINPEAPVFPEGMELLVWLQPRFPPKVFPIFGQYMAGGGKAIVAVQHYNVLQRQFRGLGFNTVYWPQPQFHGFNDYLKLIGARQVGDKVADQPGEVLYDRNHARLALATHVNRSAFREYDEQEVSKPFLIRAVAEGLSRASVVTSRLGELLFIWGSRFALDREQLARLGIAASTLVSTSDHAWTYAWSGGNLPESSFEEPKERLDGPQPLAVLLEGAFPRLEFKKEEAAGRDSMKLAEPVAGGPRKEGKMLLVGCSEMFKNSNLYLPEYQHDQFLLNAAALLAYGPEMAEVEAHVPAARSFPFQEPGTKLALRAIAVALAPALLLAYWLLHLQLRRRPVLRD